MGRRSAGEVRPAWLRELPQSHEQMGVGRRGVRALRAHIAMDRFLSRTLLGEEGVAPKPVRAGEHRLPDFPELVDWRRPDLGPFERRADSVRGSITARHLPYSRCADLRAARYRDRHGVRAR